MAAAVVIIAGLSVATPVAAFGAYVRNQHKRKRAAARAAWKLARQKAWDEATQHYERPAAAKKVVFPDR